MQQTDIQPDHDSDHRQEQASLMTAQQKGALQGDVLKHPQPDAVMHVAATDTPYQPQVLTASDRPDKFALETRLIELGAALSSAQQLFKGLERDFYLATFGRYDD